MSSGFVSGGTAEQPLERNELWRRAEEEVEAARQRKQEQKNHDGRSLYEVLQANKAAKQEAFEESIKLKNQFRSLDEDDVDFLNSVRDANEAKHAAVQRETLDRLDVFREQQRKQTQDISDKDTPVPQDGVDVAENEEAGKANWQKTSRKRKRPMKDSKNLIGAKMATTPTENEEISGAIQTGSQSAYKSLKQDPKGASSIAAEQRSISHSTKHKTPTTNGPRSIIGDPKGKSSGNSSDDNTHSNISTGLKFPVESDGGKLGLSGYSSDDE